MKSEKLRCEENLLQLYHKGQLSFNRALRELFAPDLNWDSTMDALDEAFPSYSMRIGFVPKYTNSMLENTEIWLTVNGTVPAEERVKIRTLGTQPTIIIRSLLHKLRFFGSHGKEEMDVD